MLRHSQVPHITDYTHIKSVVIKLTVSFTSHRLRISMANVKNQYTENESDNMFCDYVDLDPTYYTMYEPLYTCMSPFMNLYLDFKNKEL